jgi:hypothetical protein
MLNNISKDPPIPFFGTIVPFDDQKEQIEGKGWGNRYKVALHVSTSLSEAEIQNAKIEYALCGLPSTGGSGAGGRFSTVKISQGDVVYGFKYGGRKGVAIIFGVLGRNPQTKLGTTRFSPKSGFYGDNQPLNIMGRNEFNSMNEIPVPISNTGSTDKTKKREVPKEACKAAGIDPDGEAKSGELATPEGNGSTTPPVINSIGQVVPKSITGQWNPDFSEGSISQTDFDNVINARGVDDIIKQQALLDGIESGLISEGEYSTYAQKYLKQNQ